MVSSFRDLENFDHPECKPEIENFWRLNYVRKFDNVLESNVLELLNDRRLREELFTVTFLAFSRYFYQKMNFPNNVFKKFINIPKNNFL